MIQRTTLILSITVMALLIACGSTDEFYTIEIIDGVRTVHNIKPLWGDDPRVGLELTQKYGNLDSNDDNYLLFRPSDVAVDSKGDVYVLDRGNNRIQKYNRKGEYLLTIGKEGQGPGEFMSPLRFSITKDDTIIVSDIQNSRFQLFSSDGENLGSYRQPDITIRSDVYSNVTMLTVTLPYGENDSRSQPFSVYTMKGELIREFGKYFDFGRDGLNHTHQDVHTSITPDDYLVTSVRGANAIDKYSPTGEHLFRADRPLSYNHTYKTKTRNVELPDGRSLSFEILPTVSFQLGVDHKDRIWVWTFRYDNSVELDEETRTSMLPEEKLELHIFDKDGIFLGIVPMPVEPSRLKIYSDRIFFVEAVNEMVVYEYKIVEK